jgi:N-ethylmaleimide reductase
MAPMTRDRSPGAVPNALNARYYGQRSGAGLIVTEGTAPHALGLGYIDIPGLFTDEQAAGWSKVGEAAHAGGARVFVQLMHTGRVSHPSFLGGATPLAPSAVRADGTTFTEEGPQPFVTPKAMTEADIEEALAAYAHAARLAVDAAGLDGVEVHGANGYLPGQFLAPNANIREDAWGGDLPRRARFLLEAVDRAAEAIGGDRVGVRVSPGGTFNDIHDPNWPETYAYLAEQLNARPLAYLHTIAPPPAPGPDPDSAERADAVAIIRARYKGLLILNGGYDRARADADIAAGRGDLVSFGVPFIANPDLPERLRSGAPLAQPDPTTFYSGGERGYADYPALDHPSVAAE